MIPQGDLFSGSDKPTPSADPNPSPPQARPTGSTMSFTQAYNRLNPEQKKAVDLIEGPVMVNAGPGTGKTQILANRIGKILLEQDIAPHNILCLTYTDSGAIAMRNRLVEFIGPTAHQVHIFTFHSFCNQVIQENLDIFGSYRQLEPITELETVDVFRKLIDNLSDDNPLKRFKYDKYIEVQRMQHLFQLMKKENISPTDMHQRISTYLDGLEDNPEFIYKRKYTNKKTGITYKQGDVKETAVAAERKKYRELQAAVDQYENYMKVMDEASRYDFNDMILWVIKHFEENEVLLSSYQERYQYFLVDEYQDTNGSQNTLLEQLISYWDAPNVFVVGDDDQAIFKFQGANLGNILSFREKYNPAIIVLKENYRSNQLILDKSKELIRNNTERLILQIPGLTKELIASGKYKADTTKPSIISFEKISDEYAYIASQIENIKKLSPNELSETAVIFRWHRQVADLVEVLEKREIPLNIKRRVNILNLPMVKNLINILSYLNEEFHKYGSGQHRLFELLHYKYFGIDSLDLGKIALYCQKLYLEKEVAKWREIIANRELLETLDLKNIEAILNTSQLLDRWISEISVSTLQVSFGQIINEGGILQHIMLSEDKAWRLQVLSTFFDLIKKETAKDPKLNLKSLLAMIIKMEENKISIPVNKTISSDKGVHLITAHSAKGLEFKNVFILGCTKDIWDKSMSSYGQYSYPESVNADSKTNEQDERRLFYVAMTRAEKKLVLTYSNKNETGKNLAASIFIDQIRTAEESSQESLSVKEDIVADFYYNLLLRKKIEVPLIEKDLIDNWLKGYKLSVTHLNKFLRCPLSFYFEAILKVPGARNASTGFGNAMHETLHHFFKNIKDPEQRDLSRLTFLYENSLTSYRSHFTDEEFEDYMTHGKMTLKSLHEDKMEAWLAVPDYGLEADLKNAQYKGVPLKGVLDKVEIYPTHVNVVDYKTGKHKAEKIKRPSEKLPAGGDYWRQIVFYKMLLDSDKKNNWSMASGKIAYVEPDRKTSKFQDVQIDVTPEDLRQVGEQVTDTYNKIKAYEFNKTCEDKNCQWCNFVDNNYKIVKSDKVEEEHSYDEEHTAIEL